MNHGSVSVCMFERRNDGTICMLTYSIYLFLWHRLLLAFIRHHEKNVEPILRVCGTAHCTLTGNTCMRVNLYSDARVISKHRK